MGKLHDLPPSDHANSFSFGIRYIARSLKRNRPWVPGPESQIVRRGLPAYVICPVLAPNMNTYGEDYQAFKLFRTKKVREQDNYQREEWKLVWLKYLANQLGDPTRVCLWSNGRDWSAKHFSELANTLNCSSRSFECVTLLSCFKPEYVIGGSAAICSFHHLY